MRWRSRATGRAGRAAHCAGIRDPDYVRGSGRDRGRLGTAGFPGARASCPHGLWAAFPIAGWKPALPGSRARPAGGSSKRGRLSGAGGGEVAGALAAGRDRCTPGRHPAGLAAPLSERLRPLAAAADGESLRVAGHLEVADAGDGPPPPLAGDEHRPLPVRGQEPALGVDLLAVEAGADVEPELFGPTKTPGLPSSISASSNRLKLRRQRFVSIRRGSRLRTVRSESVRLIPGHGAIGARHLERHLSRFVHTVTPPSLPVRFQRARAERPSRSPLRRDWQTAARADRWQTRLSYSLKWGDA